MDCSVSSCHCYPLCSALPLAKAGLRTSRAWGKKSEWGLELIEPELRALSRCRVLWRGEERIYCRDFDQ